MDLLPRKLAEEVFEHYRIQSARRRSDTKTIICATTMSMSNLKIAQRATTGPRKFDLIVYAIPFTGLRHLKANGLRIRQRRAIQQLHYDNACKVILEFSSRSGTRRPAARRSPISRSAHGLSGRAGGKHGGCVLLASSAWGADSLRWSALMNTIALVISLSDVAGTRCFLKSFAEVRRRHVAYLDQDSISEWCVALFEPYQLGDLFADV